MGVDDDLAGELLRELIAERFIEPLASALAPAPPQWIRGWRLSSPPPRCSPCD